MNPPVRPLSRCRPGDISTATAVALVPLVPRVPSGTASIRSRSVPLIRGQAPPRPDRRVRHAPSRAARRSGRRRARGHPAVRPRIPAAALRAGTSAAPGRRGPLTPPISSRGDHVGGVLRTTASRQRRRSSRSLGSRASCLSHGARCVPGRAPRKSALSRGRGSRASVPAGDRP